VIVVRVQSTKISIVSPWKTSRESRAWPTWVNLSMFGSSQTTPK